MSLVADGARWLRETAEERLGVSIQPSGQVARWTAMEQEFSEFAANAEELALYSLDYMEGRPHEMSRHKRIRLAQLSRIALLQDPLAGAEAELLANFGFGKGVSKPSARNPKVQEIIDEAWTDPINEQTVTGYAAQRKLSNELLCAGELLITYYQGGGKVRCGRLSTDRLRTIVTDPENANIPLWYVVSDVPAPRWDFKTRMYDTTQMLDAQGRDKVKYWAHWRNVDDAKADRARLGTEDDELPLEDPPAPETAEGVVYHIAINQTGEQLRGNPPWTRSLRFFTAMNVLTEAHVTMAQAASTFIARRAMTGSPRQVTKAANSVLSQVGELGAAALRQAGGWGLAGNAEATTEPFTGPDTPGPFPPGSWWNDNQSSKLEALNLNSGAGQMRDTAQIVRAPIAASSQFGQHYLGDTSDTNLATAATLELPATMRVGGWQETFEQFYRWFTDRAIEAAVKAGRLGGSASMDGDKPLAEMRMAEAEDRAAMEKRTGKDLNYEFTMPFPGRRALADVTTAVQVVSQTMDPNGVNIALRKIMLRFFFEQIGIDDVAQAIEDSIPEKGLEGGIGPQAKGSGFTPAAAPGAPAPNGATGAGAGAGANDPAAGQQPYGAKSGSAAAADGALESFAALEGEWLSADARAAVDAMTGNASKLFAEILANPTLAAATGLERREHA